MLLALQAYFLPMAANAAFLASALLLGVAFGLRPQDVTLNVGWPKVPLPMPGGRYFYLGPIPVSSSIDYLGRLDGAWQAGGYARLGRAGRLALAAGAQLACLGVAGVLLGPDAAFDAFVAAPLQFAAGALEPAAIGPRYLAGYFELLAAGAWPAALGLVLTKYAAFNLIPFPLSPVYEALRTPPAGPGEDGGRTPASWEVAACMAFAIAGVVWMGAYALAAWRHVA